MSTQQKGFTMSTLEKAATPAASKFVAKVVRKVVVPVLKIGADTVYVKLMQPIEHKVKMEKDDTGTLVQKSISVMQVTNLETGEIAQIVVGDVLEKNLVENYPNDTYVGKGFAFTKKDVPGKRYKMYDIDEIEV